LIGFILLLSFDIAVHFVIGTQKFMRKFAGVSSACKAPAAVAPKRRYGAPRRQKGWRSPRRFAYFGHRRIARSV
jgi:hypothetical protein